jgi:hypothetical protein
LSLIEVLISMFVMTIGLLGLAALIPVGQAMMSRGAIDEQKAIVGRQVLRDLKIQGMFKPPLGIPRSAQTPPNQWVCANPRLDSEQGDAFCFDPLAIARHGAAAGVFPAGRVNGQPWMQRVWPLKLAAAAPAMQQLLAERLCMSDDDLVFERPADGDRMAIPFRSDSTLARTFDGNFTWFATAVRDMQAADQDTFTVSVAVAHKRALGARGMIADLQAAERVLPISNAANLRLGGDIELTSDLDLSGSLKPGRWLMLCASPNNAEKSRGLFRWYRIRSANQQGTLWRLSLAGPQWPWPTPPTTNAVPVFAIVPEGVVGVYERTMRIERPSFFNGYQ